MASKPKVGMGRGWRTQLRIAIVEVRDFYWSSALFGQIASRRMSCPSIIHTPRGVSHKRRPYSRDALLEEQRWYLVLNVFDSGRSSTLSSIGECILLAGSCGARWKREGTAGSLYSGQPALLANHQKQPWTTGLRFPAPYTPLQDFWLWSLRVAVGETLAPRDDPRHRLPQRRSK